MHERAPKSYVPAIHALNKREDVYINEISRYKRFIKPTMVVSTGLIGLALTSRSARRISILGGFVAGLSAGAMLFAGERASARADSMRIRANELRHRQRTDPKLVLVE